MTAQSKVEASLASAMAAAFGEIEAATKAGKNDAFKRNGKASGYATLETVIEAVKPALIAHGLFFTQHCHPSETGVIVETVLGHSGGDSLSLGSLYVPANKKDAHGFGSALTYARRYALMTAFGVPTEDDDGNAAVKAGEESGLINDDQLGVLQGYASGGVIDAARFCNFFQIADLSKLPADRYDEALRMAKAKAEKAKELAK